MCLLKYKRSVENKQRKILQDSRGRTLILHVNRKSDFKGLSVEKKRLEGTHRARRASPVCRRGSSPGRLLTCSSTHRRPLI